MDEFEELKAAQEFDSALQQNAPFSEIRNLFDRYGEDCTGVFGKMKLFKSILSAEFFEQYNKAQLWVIWRFLRFSSYYRRDGMNILAVHIVQNQRIPVKYRAFIFDVIPTVNLIRLTEEDMRLLPLGVLVNCSEIRLPRVMKKLIIGRTKDETTFLKNCWLLCSGITYKKGREILVKSIQNDSVSQFEITRQLLGLDVEKRLLDSLVSNGAINIFFYLLLKCPKKVLRDRSLELWLFAICRDLNGDKALPFINKIEELRPGVIASAKDPWGNNLLWYIVLHKASQQINRMFCRDEAIKYRLIELGCDPDSKNMFGLSARLVEENNERSYEEFFFCRFYGCPTYGLDRTRKDRRIFGITP